MEREVRAEKPDTTHSARIDRVADCGEGGEISLAFGSGIDAVQILP